MPCGGSFGFSSLLCRYNWASIVREGLFCPLEGIQMRCLYSNQDQWEQWDQPFRCRYLCLASFHGHLREQMNAFLRYLALTQDLILGPCDSLMLPLWQQTWAEVAE